MSGIRYGLPANRHAAVDRNVANRQYRGAYARSDRSARADVPVGRFDHLNDPNDPNDPNGPNDPNDPNEPNDPNDWKEFECVALS